MIRLRGSNRNVVNVMVLNAGTQEWSSPEYLHRESSLWERYLRKKLIANVKRKTNNRLSEFFSIRSYFNAESIDLSILYNLPPNKTPKSHST